MTYYMDNNQIRELMLETAYVEVHDDLSVLVSDPTLSMKDVTLYLFDTSLFSPSLPDATVWSNFMLAHCPDWGGLILEMMNNDKVYLYWGIKWCRVLYRENLDDFRFIHCSNPIMADDHSCLIFQDPMTHNVRDAIKSLMEAIRFAQDIAKRLMGKSKDRGLKSMLNFQHASYREICLNLEDLVSEILDQQEERKERFFLKGMEEDDNKLCCCCKENMRQTFHEKGDEEAALKWRPGRWGDCPARNCKHYSWESFAEEYHKDYIVDLKTKEFSDQESY